MDQVATVIVVDDDQSVRESLPELIREYGYHSRAYTSAEEYLSSSDAQSASCLILDMAMPEMGGRELQIELRRLQAKLPIIFITATQSAAARQLVIDDGAAACLMKPFRDRDLLNAIEHALERSERSNL
ncbi:response regulator transcription factor [Granulicella paludicola]|uniref:response regulator transcription factor n=1 Tax=Granulicella paludicola TaxID=474951 RepID=UPI0021DFA2BD|nr:response regulator [Granulicella paludicola]